MMLSYSMKPKVEYKYNESKLLKDIQEYIDETYNQHYAGENGIQSIDITFASGHLEGFTIGNIQKLGFRYGKKDGYNRKDILKLIHYGILLLHNHDTFHSGEKIEPIKLPIIPNTLLQEGE